MKLDSFGRDTELLKETARSIQNTIAEKSLTVSEAMEVLDRARTSIISKTIVSATDDTKSDYFKDQLNKVIDETMNRLD